MPIKAFHKEWTQEIGNCLKDGRNQEICDKLEGYRKQYFDLFEENYPAGLDIDHQTCAEDWGYFLYFLGFYNCSRLLCEKDACEVVTPELVPSLDWINHILFPDKYPHPGDIDKDLPSP